LFERAQHFELGSLLGFEPQGLSVLSPSSSDAHALSCFGIGIWECDLADDRLTWSPEVYDIFGLPHGANVRREETVALYAEESRAVMERLRAYAIKHRRGFTLDAKLRLAQGAPRWMRLVASPTCDINNRVIGLRGIKHLI